VPDQREPSDAGMKRIEVAGEAVLRRFAGDRYPHLLCTGTDIDSAEWQEWLGGYAVMVSESLGGLTHARQEELAATLAAVFWLGYEMSELDVEPIASKSMT
jgi:hypothetical protein